MNVDLLLSCGEIISAALFAEGLCRMGLPAVALTGWQCGITTDGVHLGARVLEVHGERLWQILRQGRIPVVAGFQGVTEDGVVTTLGRGGSDTTAAVLGVVLKAERVEIYTDVDGGEDRRSAACPRCSHSPGHVLPGSDGNGAYGCEGAASPGG